MYKKSESEETWYDKIQRSWVINVLVIPTAISLLCNLIVHWMR